MSREHEMRNISSDTRPLHRLNLKTLMFDEGSAPGDPLAAYYDQFDGNWTIMDAH